MMVWTEGDRTQIRSVIEAQLQAFQDDNAEVAFEFASPGIQDMFRTPVNFLQMVRQSYQAVYRPRSVIFEDLVLLQDLPTQPVLLLSADGVPVRALYLMENKSSGDWRITGCYLIPVE
jgi:Domain of unknown function (DUF4864)